MQRHPILRDFLLLFGILPIEMPSKHVQQRYNRYSFYVLLSVEERQENKITTEKLLQLFT